MMMFFVTMVHGVAPNPKGQHNGDTSDEDHSDEEDDKKRDIPVATVVAVEQIDAKSPESKKKEGWW